MANLSSKHFLSSLDGPWSSGSSPVSGDDRSQAGSGRLGNKFSGSDSSGSRLQEGCSLRGAFECKGDLLLEGFIEGDVVVGGQLIVAESATIRANVRAKSVRVFGRVLGDLLCSDLIELHVGSQVRGNLKTRRLLIQDGVTFDGRCEMEGPVADDSECEV